MEEQNITEIGTDIAKAGMWLSQGACVGIPTETVYGLAANALDAMAISGIFAIKNRPTFDPLIVHFPNIDAVRQYTTDFSKALEILAERFWPGPLTILLPRRDVIPDLVTSGLPRVAVRIPAHPLAQTLLQSLPFPLAAPSANPFGYISPTTAQHVADQLGGKIPYILDGGSCSIGLESTIVGWENNTVVVYRLGGISLEAIKEVAGNVEVQLNQSSNPHAPGMLKSHYSPRKPLYLNNLLENIQKYRNQKIGILCLSEKDLAQGWKEINGASKIVYLSKQGDLNEAARNLFSALRQLDQMDIDIILAESVPEEGLGKAINDRLRRAAVSE